MTLPLTSVLTAEVYGLKHLGILNGLAFTGHQKRSAMTERVNTYGQTIAHRSTIAHAWLRRTDYRLVELVAHPNVTHDVCCTMDNDCLTLTASTLNHSPADGLCAC